MNSEIYEKLPPTKLFFHCAIPAMISMVAGALFQIADGLFVGRFIGEDALAAVNLIMPIMTIVFAFSNMIATGASVRISMLLGEKKRAEASAVFSFTVKAILILSCIIGALGLVFAEPFVRLLSQGASEQAIQYGITYTRVYAMFSPLVPIYFATDNFLRICGKQKLSMWVGIVTQGLNVILDTIFIAVLQKGVLAAALTSCFSMALGSIVTLWLFRGKRMDLYYTRENIPMSVFARILANGSSEFFSNISMSVMDVVYNFFLLSYGGTTGVASFSVIMYVDSIIGMLMFGMCDALQPAISYSYGANHMDKVKALFKRIVIGSIFFSGLSMLFMLFAGQYVAPIFVKPEDTELLAVSIEGMKIFAFGYLTGWVDLCFSSYFTALEHPGRSLLTSLFGTVVFPLIFLMILPPIWQLKGIWLVAVFASAASAVFTLILAATMSQPKAMPRSVSLVR